MKNKIIVEFENNHKIIYNGHTDDIELFEKITDYQKSQGGEINIFNGYRKELDYIIK